MRTREWSVCLVLAGLAVACGDQPTGPDQEPASGPGKIALAAATSEDGRSIVTDKDDYQPGDTVWFTGAGWAPGDSLDIVLTDDPTLDSHQWVVGIAGDGTFRDSTYVVDTEDLGVTFTLTATSREHPEQALTVTFTDAIQTAPIEVREATCITAQSSFAPGATVCGRAGPVTRTGTGNNNFRIQWVGPSPSSAVLQTIELENVASNSIHTATFTPSGPGTYTVRTLAGSSGGNVLSSADFTVSAPSNAPPVLATIGDQVVAELTQLAFTATATDENVATLSFSLASPASGTFPTGAAFTAGGAFTWTPSEAQGPGVYRAKIVVTDEGSLSDAEEIEITVGEANLSPELGSIGAKAVDEEMALSFTATATDPDLPANALTYSLEAGTDPVPAGAAINATSGAFSWTPTEAQGPGVYKFKVRVTDDGDNPDNLFDEEEITVTVSEVNKPPVLGSIGNKTVNEGSLLSFTVTATDPDIPANTLAFSLQTGGNADLASASLNPTSGAFTWTPADDNPTGTPSDNYGLTVVVTDDGVNPPSLTDDEQITISVNNVAPSITGVTLDPPTAGYLYPIASQPKVQATWSDPGANDTHGCTYGITDVVLNSVVSTGLACGTAMTAPAAGLYTVQVTVTDDDTGADTESFPTDGSLIVIYDPSAGFVTGGGWIDSPADACRYAACTSATTGKATFGFVSKYLKGTTTPTGNTEFQFQAGGLNFKSTSYEWLVVNGNSGRAQYKGVGTINGAGGFGFILTAYDGSSDRFRIKIWDVGTSEIVYDNQRGESDSSTGATALGGGSIIVQTKK